MKSFVLTLERQLYPTEARHGEAIIRLLVHSFFKNGPCFFNLVRCAIRITGQNMNCHARGQSCADFDRIGLLIVPALQSSSKISLNHVEVKAVTDNGGNPTAK